ncbi:MAG TPA: hypothetical protein VJQ57_05275 [Acidimicrobiia bacterium]|nr:hypothetical protein [Acidimicrobiia bacterium]
MTRLREAVASDLALHGFLYLGVLLTFVGVFGFLFFAFRDVPDDAQPLVELAIPLVFFGWAWGLRRRQALLIAKAMELLGGMVLPIVVFAGFVDNAPIPPDFRGGGLITAMVMACLLIALGYQWWSRRHPNTVLGFLVAPLVWLAGLIVGFVFKTDEPLQGVAITRLVSFQPALAATLITATLAWLKFRAESPPTRKAVLAALLGVPSAYLLTVALALGGGEVQAVPLLVAGVATLISVELLGNRFARSRSLSAMRPFLLATTLAPLIPVWGLAWTGVTMVVAYLAVLEWELRTTSAGSRAVPVAIAGALLGLAISVVEPRAMVAAWATASIWSHLRRIVGLPAVSSGAMSTLAALLPIGLGSALLGALSDDVAWLVMSVVVAATAPGLRWLRPGDRFGATWSTWSASVIALGSARAWLVDKGSSESAPFLVIAIASTATALALVPQSLPLRIWLTGGALSLGLAVGMDGAGVDPATIPVAWALVGLAAVIFSALWQQRVASHLGLVGHLIGLGALLGAAPDRLVAVLGAWTVGWLATVLAGEQRGHISETLSTFGQSFAGLLGQRLERWGRSLPTFILAASLPFAVLETAELWEPFAQRRAWSGVALGFMAVAYATAARSTNLRKPLSSILATGAVVLSPIAVAVAAPEPWESIATAASSIIAASLLASTARRSGFAWFAWTMSFVLVVLLAERSGVPVGSLDLAVLCWGSLLLIGGLVFDDVRSGRRRRGEGLRVDWLRYPVILGALAVPVSLGPTFAQGGQALGWWSLGTAFAYFVVAYLLRAGAVTAPAYALAVVAVTVLSPIAPMVHPWLFTPVAAALMACSWIAARPDHGSRTGGWLRWDLPALVVAHLVAGVALARAAQLDQVPWTAVGFGILSLLVGVVRRNRIWAEAGIILMLIGAGGFGPQWLGLALLAPAGYSVWRATLTTGTTRVVYQAASAVSAGWAFVQTIVWQDWSPSQAVSVGAVTFGLLAALVTSLIRFGGLARDWAATWGGLASIGMVATIAASPGYVEGPALAGGLGLFAVAAALAARPLAAWLHNLSVVSTAGAWIALVIGLDWNSATAGLWTSVAGGGLAMAVTESQRLARRLRPRSPEQALSVDPARSWWALAAIGVVAAVVLAIPSAQRQPIWLVVGTSLSVVAVAAARGAVPFGWFWLRETSGVLALGTITAWAYGFEVSAAGIALAATGLGVVATVLQLGLRNRPDWQPWLRPLVVTATLANVEGLLIAIGLLPRRDLLVAVLLAFGVQAVATGLILDRPVILAIGPPLICVAWLGIATESLTGTSQWYTAPVALTLLGEVEIARRSSGRGRAILRGNQLRLLEWTGIGLLELSPLAEMFAGDIFFGLLAFGYAAVLLVWAVLTRIRRRVVAALVFATVAAALTISTAAASAAPSSAFFWIMAAGTGLAVMLTIGIVESFRTRSGAAMQRLDLLMKEWE